ncbi:MAG: heme-binding protein [Gammaproteobacteria bacterium]|nr:heme-binding protein [Gammaproteobacteria bacterium]MDH5276449.1 heme-binding protein [Gammaproteobacteria bacterium]
MNRPAHRYFVLRAALGFLVLLAGEQAMAIEQPRYEVAYRDGDVEYRQYEPYLVAETEVTDADDFDAAGNEGFRRLFRYIAGGNDGGSEIAMTAPVTQDKKGAKIAMTTPVAQDPSPEGWRIAFMLPSAFTIDTAPRPTDKRVYIRQVPGKLVATLRFSGRWTTRNYERYKAELARSLQAAGVSAVTEPMVARYNPPYTPPFLRRNEISVQVDQLPAATGKE